MKEYVLKPYNYVSQHPDKTVRVLAGLLVGVVAGIIKEIYDKYNNGTVDVLDSFATTVGALIGFYIFYF